MPVVSEPWDLPVCVIRVCGKSVCCTSTDASGWELLQSSTWLHSPGEDEAILSILVLKIPSFSFSFLPFLPLIFSNTQELFIPEAYNWAIDGLLVSEQLLHLSSSLGQSEQQLYCHEKLLNLHIANTYWAEFTGVHRVDCMLVTSYAQTLLMAHRRTQALCSSRQTWCGKCHSFCIKELKLNW